MEREQQQRKLTSILYGNYELAVESFSFLLTAFIVCEKEVKNCGSTRIKLNKI